MAAVAVPSLRPRGAGATVANSSRQLSLPNAKRPRSSGATLRAGRATAADGTPTDHAVGGLGRRTSTQGVPAVSPPSSSGSGGSSGSFSSLRRPPQSDPGCVGGSGAGGSIGTSGAAAAAGAAAVAASTAPLLGAHMTCNLQGGSRSAQAARALARGVGGGGGGGEAVLPRTRPGAGPIGSSGVGASMNSGGSIGGSDRDRSEFRDRMDRVTSGRGTGSPPLTAAAKLTSAAANSSGSSGGRSGNGVHGRPFHAGSDVEQCGGTPPNAGLDVRPPVNRPLRTRAPGRLMSCPAGARGSIRGALPGIRETQRRRFPLEPSPPNCPARARRVLMEDPVLEEDEENAAAEQEDDSDSARASGRSSGVVCGGGGTSATTPEPRRPATPHRDIAETFSPFNWLSDASISYAYAWLSFDSSGIFRNRNRRLPKNVLLMDPAMAFWLSVQVDPACVQEATDALKLQELDLVLCPINDSSVAEVADTGTHWTLLVCWRPHRNGRENNGFFDHFYYYDSLELKGLDEDGLRNARAIACHLAGRQVQLSASPCAQQTNYCDCGVYVLMFSEIVAALALDAEDGAAGGSPPWESRLNMVTRDEATAYRAHYHSLAIGEGDVTV
eukprot:TRINITY_DN9844_c0_g1_i1.p1 TRINITY_DN9844_c0_g1~~TRINITY_DN9844_c0_g1_i1.p1  ORF type:complete len:619 (-),score=105.71 TRINITY_DN9844_c0_g1_i1:326-2161(-)